MQSSGVSPECLVQLAMRLHISKINYRTNDSYFVTLCTRRRTLSEKRSGGTLAEPLPWRIVLPEELTFTEALDKMAELQMTLFKHMDYPYLECRELVRKLFDYSPIAASSSMMFSWFPIGKDTMNGWDYEFTGYSLGRYIMPLYSFAMYDAHSGCFKFSYMHRTNMITSEHIKALHEKTVRAPASRRGEPRQNARRDTRYTLILKGETVMLEKIAEIICEYVYIDPAEITEQANLRTDIGLSSLDLMSVASDMENTFGVKIPERAILTAKTVKDLIACVG